MQAPGSTRAVGDVDLSVAEEVDNLGKDEAAVEEVHGGLDARPLFARLLFDVEC